LSRRLRGHAASQLGAVAPDALTGEAGVEWHVDSAAHMKPRELLYLLGIRPSPRTYPYEVMTFELPKDGQVQYAQWLHPAETRKLMRQEAVDEIRKFVAPGDVAIDIGAHTGDTTIPIALAAGPKGCVLAVEPNPYVFPVLQKNSELNPGKAHIVPLMIAATTEPGEFYLEYSDAGFCNGGLHDGISKWRHGHAFKLRARGENLQSYIGEHFPALAPRIRFLKVDAEGYDYQVLASLKNLISSQKPFIKAEVYKLLNLAQRERLYDLLAELGYNVFVVESDASYLGHKLNRQDLMIRRHYDIFCVPGN
jgi:FkbM family methyltransferase